LSMAASSRSRSTFARIAAAMTDGSVSSAWFTALRRFACFLPIPTPFTGSLPDLEAGAVAVSDGAGRLRDYGWGGRVRTMTIGTQIALLLAAGQVAISETVAYVFPKQRPFIMAGAGLLVVGVIAASLRLVPGETVWNAFVMIVPAGAVQLWLYGAHRYRKRMADETSSVRTNAVDARVLAESVRAQLTEHHDWVRREIETARVSLNSELSLRAREEAEELRQIVEAGAGAMKNDVDQRFTDVFRDLRELRSELKGPNQIVEDGVQKRIDAFIEYPSISQLNYAIEQHRNAIWGIKEYLSPQPAPSPEDPDWNEYLEHREYIPLWQAVALAFGYEPSKLRRADTGEADLRTHFDPNTNHFKMWMDRAVSSLGGELPCQSVDGINSRVTLYDFSKWAVARYFPGLPERLRLLAQIEPARA
jgi:hypothetical protein